MSDSTMTPQRSVTAMLSLTVPVVFSNPVFVSMTHANLARFEEPSAERLAVALAKLAKAAAVELATIDIERTPV